MSERIAPTSGAALAFGMLLFAAIPVRAASGADTLQLVLDRLTTAQRLCGVAVAVIRNRTLDAVHTASGCQPPLELSAQSTFQAASLGKPLFAYAVLQLSRQGRLGLDVPLSKYLLEDPVQDERLNLVTARMVLTHTSGLSNGSTLRFVSSPGVEWRYSGAGFGRLQRAVETIVDEPLDQLMRRIVFEPASMEHSAYVWGDRVAAGYVPAFAFDGRRNAPRPFTAPMAASTLYTSAADYARFVAVLLNDTALLEQTTKAPVVADADLGLSWGLGWGLEAAEEDLFIWHWGNNPGYKAFVVASLRTGDGFVLLTDGDGGLDLARPVAALIVPGAHRMFRFRMLNPSVPCRLFGFCS